MHCYRSTPATVCASLFSTLLMLCGASAAIAEPGPQINREFPIRGADSLSPPIVDKPIHECAVAVHVRGALPHALVTVFANNTEQVGKSTLWVGEGDIQLNRPLKINESISAKQIVDGVTSHASIVPVVVTAFPPGALGKPEVAADLWGCGVVVPVGKLAASTTVNVFEDGVPIGAGHATGDWLPVVTQALSAGRGVTAQQVICNDDPSRRIEGPLSDPAIIVKTAPNPPPAPIVDPNSVIPGKDTVVLDGLFTGAEGIVRDRGTVVSSGLFATGPANWFPVSPAVSAPSKIDAAQELCARSPFSTPVDPVTTLPTPILVGPICDKQQFVVIKNTVLGAYVVVLANGGVVGYGAGNGGELILGLGRPLHASPQDNVSVRQYFGSIVSSSSNSVAVTGGIGAAVIEIDGGEPFFIAERGEQQIDGPVFPRGRGPGPVFKIQTCCGDGVRAEVLGPDGSVVSELALDEVFPGYFTARWNWTSQSGWASPAGIPFGAYALRVTSHCHQERADARFYVIADPNEVAGPQRFSFEETAIWFYAPTNRTVPLTYALHPDDARIFSRAIAATSGETSTLKAATKMAAAEANLFAYSITKSDNDTLELLQDTLAQCADDAAMLTALLRSVGIPAHPVTADAAPETGSISWGFDTWTEFLVPGATSPEWKVVHTHFPNNATIEGPIDRNTFGHTLGVASREANDLVVMANPDWLWSDIDGSAAVSFSRNQCGQPNQSLTAKTWIGELCEDNYWSPDVHWGCPVGSSGTHGLSLGGDLRIDYRDRMTRGSVILTNPLKKRLKGRYTLELLADIPETMSIGDRVLASRKLKLAMRAGETQKLRFEFRFGDGPRPGETLVIRVASGDATVAFVELPETEMFRVEGARAQNLRLDAEGLLEVTITNTARVPIHGLNVRVQGPAEVRLKDEARGYDVLGAGESAVVRVALTGVAPLEAGSLVVLVATRDAGVKQLRVPLRIRPEHSSAEPARASVTKR